MRSDMHLLRVCLRVGFDLEMADMLAHHLEQVGVKGLWGGVRDCSTFPALLERAQCKTCSDCPAGGPPSPSQKLIPPPPS